MSSQAMTCTRFLLDYTEDFVIIVYDQTSGDQTVFTGLTCVRDGLTGLFACVPSSRNTSLLLEAKMWTAFGWTIPRTLCSACTTSLQVVRLSSQVSPAFAFVSQVFSLAVPLWRGRISPVTRAQPSEGFGVGGTSVVCPCRGRHSAEGVRRTPCVMSHTCRVAFATLRSQPLLLGALGVAACVA